VESARALSEQCILSRPAVLIRPFLRSRFGTRDAALPCKLNAFFSRRLTCLGLRNRGDIGRASARAVASHGLAWPRRTPSTAGSSGTHAFAASFVDVDDQNGTRGPEQPIISHHAQITNKVVLQLTRSGQSRELTSSHMIRFSLSVTIAIARIPPIDCNCTLYRFSCCLLTLSEMRSANPEADKYGSCTVILNLCTRPRKS
jgi:hypothetical protein